MPSTTSSFWFSSSNTNTDHCHYSQVFQAWEPGCLMDVCFLCSPRRAGTVSAEAPMQSLTPSPSLGAILAQDNQFFGVNDQSLDRCNHPNGQPHLH